MGWTPHTTSELESAGLNSGAIQNTSGSPVIIYPNSNGTTGGSSPNYNQQTYSSSNSSDIYGGTPISFTVNTGNESSASGLETLSAGLSSSFSDLFDLIRENTNINNAWSAEQAQKQMDFQTNANQIAMDFSASEAAKNRDWQEYMSNTAHQREVADLKAAGLNPVLSASGGNGAPVGSGSAASGVTSAGAKADADQSANSALASIYSSILAAQTNMYNTNMSAQTNLKIAEMQQATSQYSAELAADASKYAAGTNYAASTYSANKAAETASTSNPWQIASTIVDNLTGSNNSGNRGSGYGNAINTGLNKLNQYGSSWKNTASNSKLGKTLTSFGKYLLGKGVS